MRYPDTPAWRLKLLTDIYFKHYYTLIVCPLSISFLTFWISIFFINAQSTRLKFYAVFVFTADFQSWQFKGLNQESLIGLV